MKEPPPEKELVLQKNRYNKKIPPLKEPLERRDSNKKVNRPRHMVIKRYLTSYQNAHVKRGVKEVNLKK